MRKPNFFASGAIDRASHLRRDPEWLDGQLRDSRTRFLPVGRNGVFMAGNALAFLTADELPPGHERAGMVFLGLDGDEAALFGVDVSGGAVDGASEMDLRGAAMLLGPDDGNRVAYASAMVTWHRRHRWCGTCGDETAPGWGGHVRTCPGCGAEHFPRTDPVIIVLVTAGDHCLLGRQPVWPPRMWSALAGFVEPGESLEDAVAREVGEEAGVRVADVRYHSSQPWPFPLSLMLGFMASAGPAPVPVTVDASELDDARWFGREELEEGIADGGVLLPPPFSIARQLVDTWRSLPDGGER